MWSRARWARARGSASRVEVACRPARALLITATQVPIPRRERGPGIWHGRGTPAASAPMVPLAPERRERCPAVLEVFNEIHTAPALRLFNDRRAVHSP